jgi:cell division protease FtsH
MNFFKYLLLLSGFFSNTKGFMKTTPIENIVFKKNTFKSGNPFGRKYREQLEKNLTQNNEPQIILLHKYPIVNWKEKMRRLNSKNVSVQNNAILGLDDLNNPSQNNLSDPNHSENQPSLRIIFNNPNLLESLGIKINDDDDDNTIGFFEEDDNSGRRSYRETTKEKSKNFQVIKNYNIRFKDVGGYKNVKEELMQCIDILKNYTKYTKYNIRIPKGLIFEGPPGTGKTLLSKALAGEAKCNFISVSGSDFQEKYVGVGSARIKELFELGKKNIPCIIFIDEIDALGRKRSTDGESASSERDSTLNALLVELDGFKNNTGIFLVAATNRIDLLDSALTRPGRVDKQIFIGLPDKETREAIINIHIQGKPYDESINLTELIDITEGLTGAQIENLLNEAMLNALRYNEEKFSYKDFDLVLNKMLVGWQPNEHEFGTDIINRIAIHEMGHAIVGLFSKHHSKVTKVVINLSSPKSPGYTVFETEVSNIYIREALFEHLMILLSGRIAEEIFYGISVTTGAINDFEEALKLAEKMILYYGMGNNIIYPNTSEKYKEIIDIEVMNLINKAYKHAESILSNSKDLIYETSEMLKKEKILKIDTLTTLIEKKYNYLKF